jgi:hypothetical protein
VARGERDLGPQNVVARALVLVERPGLRRGEQPAGRVERTRLEARLRRGECPLATSSRVSGERDGTLEEGGGGGDAPASLRAAGRALELGGDILVGALRRQRAVPRAPIGVGLQIGHVRQDFVHAPSVIG